MSESETASAPPRARTSDRPSAPPDDKGALRRLLPKLLVSLALGALFAWLVVRGGVPLFPPGEAFGRVSWGFIPGYVAILIAAHFFRASRWRFLIAPVKPVPFRDVIGLNWIGFFAIFALPLRLGELARPALTKMRNGVSLSAGFGTIAVERVVDGLVTSLCVAWALFALPRRATDDQLATALPFYGYLSLAVFITAFLALGFFLWQRALATRLTERIIGIGSKRLGTLLASKVSSMADGIRSIGSPKLGGGFLLETLVYWTLNCTGMWLLGVACGLPMTFAHAVAIMGILAIGILLPAGPGLFGNFQLAISVALKLYFAEALVGSEGAVYIFLLYSIQAVFIVVVGIVPLYLMNIPFRALLRGG